LKSTYGTDTANRKELLSYAQISLSTCTLFKREAISFAGMKAQRDEGGGRIMLGDNTRGGVVMLWPIRFQCVCA